MNTVRQEHPALLSEGLINLPVSESRSERDVDPLMLLSDQDL